MSRLSEPGPTDVVGASPALRSTVTVASGEESESVPSVKTARTSTGPSLPRVSVMFQYRDAGLPPVTATGQPVMAVPSELRRTLGAGTSFHVSVSPWRYW